MNHIMTIHSNLCTWPIHIILDECDNFLIFFNVCHCVLHVLLPHFLRTDQEGFVSNLSLVFSKSPYQRASRGGERGKLLKLSTTHGKHTDDVKIGQTRLELQILYVLR